MYSLVISHHGYSFMCSTQIPLSAVYLLTKLRVPGSSGIRTTALVGLRASNSNNLTLGLKWQHGRREDGVNPECRHTTCRTR